METARGPPRVKNKQFAPQQISAEQLLREAVDRQEEKVQAPTTRFADLEELHEYQGRKRREFEDYVRRNRIRTDNWLRYAAFEAEQGDFRRMRSVFERALDALGSTNVVLWLRYIDAECKNRSLNHAFNLLDRAVTILPRNDKLWYKFVYLHQVLGDIPSARQVFERWMSWQPDENAWSAFIKMETKYNEIERARGIFSRFVQVHPEPPHWIKWARFEESYGTPDHVREVFDEAIETLGSDFMDERIFDSYARFEVKMGEFDRARAIFKLALDQLPRSKSGKLQASYTQFEKQHGDRQGVEDVILAKRRVQYEERIRQSPKDYDTWIDYIQLEESGGDPQRISEVYERAIAEMPPSQEKRHWRRYIYLWAFYATYAETTAQDVNLARSIYDKCLEIIPHSKFTFAKIWIMKAQFELRQGDVSRARKTLGQAIGRCPKDKLFQTYIQMEMQLFEFNRCRTLYEKRVEWDPSNCQAWIKFAELERGLDDLDRTRALFELAVEQPVLDMPELLWKAYIDFEEEEGEYARTRKLYERLLRKTDHVKVWISYAQFECNVPDANAPEEEDEEEDEARPLSAEAKARARKVFERAYTAMKEKQLVDDRVTLLNAWKAFEAAHGEQEDKDSIDKKMPKRVKKRRKIDEGEFEEYLTWIFPEDNEVNPNLFELMRQAQAWKAAQEAAGTNGAGDGAEH